MDNFVAIDIETANFAQSSVCSVGMVIVKKWGDCRGRWILNT